jgi:23S rRNA (guanosine2251-2'-O)-methyltransferase
LGGELIEGRRAVIELLATGRRRVRSVWIADGQAGSPQLDEIERLAARRKVRVEVVPVGRLSAAAGTDSPQGVLAVAAPVESVAPEVLCEQGASELPPFLLVVAGVTDPHNLGSLLRSAECAGVTGIVLPRHRSAHLSPTVVKVAAGAVEHLSFALVGGVPAALSELASSGVHRIGLAGESPRSLYDMEIGAVAIAVVVGNEERGLPQLVRRRCDDVVSIPQSGQIASLNVAAAAAVACFEVSRQRGRAFA